MPRPRLGPRGGAGHGGVLTRAGRDAKGPALGEGGTSHPIPNEAHNYPHRSPDIISAVPGLRGSGLFEPLRHRLPTAPAAARRRPPQNAPRKCRRRPHGRAGIADRPPQVTPDAKTRTICAHDPESPARPSTTGPKVSHAGATPDRRSRRTNIGPIGPLLFPPPVDRRDILVRPAEMMREFMHGHMRDQVVQLHIAAIPPFRQDGRAEEPDRVRLRPRVP